MGKEITCLILEIYIYNIFDVYFNWTEFLEEIIF